MAAFLRLRGYFPGPLFRSNEGSRLLSAPQVNKVLRAAADRIGLPWNSVSSHCFRIGAATAAAEAGVPTDVVRAMARWKSDAIRAADARRFDGDRGGAHTQ